MLRLRSRVRQSVRGIAPACAVLCVVSSCSLRDTSFLDSEASSGGAGSAGSAGMNGSQAGSSGGLASAGAGFAGTGGAVSMSSGGEAGELDAGSGGMAGAEEMTSPGTFQNCPPRTAWTVLSNPTVAQLQAVGSSMNIAASQLQPEYAIDEGDVMGTLTRFSTGRPTIGDEFLSIDMHAARFVSGVYTKEPTGDYGRHFQINVSLDGNTFTQVADQDGMTGAYEIRFKPVLARFVRINQTGTTTAEWWSVHDCKIYCTSEGVGGSGGGGAGGAPAAGAGGGGASGSSASGGGAGGGGGAKGGAGGATGGSGGKGGTGGT